jgi:hypothetical protein
MGMTHLHLAQAHSENNAIKVLYNPALLKNIDPGTRAILDKPTPRVKAVLDSDPAIKSNYHTVVLPLMHQNDPVAPKNLSLKQKDQIMHKLTGGQITPQQAEQAGVGGGTGGKIQQIMTEASQQLHGLGPGLLKLTGNLAEEGYNDVAHPMNHDPSMHPFSGDVKNILHQFAASAHPIKQWQQDPLGLIENAAIIPSAGAGVATRAAELTRAGELAKAGGISKGAQVAKTLMRPQPMDRSITAQFGSDTGGGLNIKPPAYKSSLGGLIQSKVLDPLLERHMTHPGPAARVVEKYAGSSSLTPFAAVNRYGRKVRQSMEDQARIKAGALSARMPEEQAGNLARGTTFYDTWRQLFESGAHPDEAALQPWRDWEAIKKPPQVPETRPEYITAQHLKDHPFLSRNESQLAQEFTSQGSHMIPNRNSPDLEANPDNYRLVPKGLIDSMKPYAPGTGTVAKGFNAMDRGTQLIRSGRFLTPAYALWAAQNGLLHASQAGAFVFRNAHQLRSEWPHLSDEVKGAIDGGTGKGIARGGNVGGASALPETGKWTRLNKSAQTFWHKFDDQWARRMSAIHELNSAGYHNASDWEKLYQKNPKKFQTIMAQSNREAINYSEMTPAERGSLQKLMTAYGWTRGASTYAARFPMMHPIQAAAGLKVANVGTQAVDKYYAQHGGMPPEYLSESLPIPGSKYVVPTSWLSPSGTLGNVISEVPGLTHGQTQSLSGELAPVPSAIMQEITGANQYNQPFQGNQRFLGPITQAISRYKPLGIGESALPGLQKKGGTFAQSLPMTGAKFAGAPIQELKNPTQTAGLGEKDFEQSLAPTDKIKFQYTQQVNNLPSELALYKKVTGSALDGNTLSRLKSDYDAVEQRDLFQYSYASQHQAKTWKALPPLTKLAGTLDWMAHHGFSNAQVASAHHLGTHLTNDKEVESLVNSLWQSTGIGYVASQWKNAVKGMRPPVLTPGNG